ncbi:MAG TPA: hypothetical protein VF552_03865 [Allosphingosinicella sp.]
MAAFIALWVENQLWWRFALVARNDGHPTGASRADKLEQAARQLGCDGEGRWEERLRQVVQRKAGAQEPGS